MINYSEDIRVFLNLIRVGDHIIIPCNGDPCDEFEEKVLGEDGNARFNFETEEDIFNYIFYDLGTKVYFISTAKLYDANNHLKAQLQFEEVVIIDHKTMEQIETQIDDFIEDTELMGIIVDDYEWTKDEFIIRKVTPKKLAAIIGPLHRAFCNYDITFKQKKGKKKGKIVIKERQA